MTTKAKLYISWIAAVGLIVLVAGLSHWQSTGLPRLLAFLFLAMVLSTQKIRLPGMKGTMSLSFPFILVGIADFGFGETLLLGCTVAFVQTLWHAQTGADRVQHGDVSAVRWIGGLAQPRDTPATAS